MTSEKQRLDSAESCRRRPCCPPPSTAYKVWVIVTSVVYVITLIINCSYSYFSMIFRGDEVNVTRPDENSGFTPPGWAFSIWGVIYPWNLVLVCYSLAALWPSTGLHRLPLPVFPIYIVNNLCGSLWFVFSEQYLRWPGTLAIVGLPITLYACITLSIVYRYKHQCRFFLYTYLVENALALYAGWCSVAYLLYTAQLLIYEHGLDKTNVGTALLSWLLIKLAIFGSLEVTLLDKYMRHVWAHYLALINAIGGSIINNFDPNNVNSIITVCLAGMCLIAFLVKMLNIFVNKCARPDGDCEGRKNAVGPSPDGSKSDMEVKDFDTPVEQEKA